MTTTPETYSPMPEIWRLLIVHRTVLSYPDTVTTSYNEVRMQPSDEPGQAVLSARLEIDPFEGVLPYIDYFGTRVSAFDIHRPHRHLAVTATTTVETFPPTESWPGTVPGGSVGFAPTSTPMSWDELAASDCDDIVRGVPDGDAADRPRRRTGRHRRRDQGRLERPVGGRPDCLRLGAQDPHLRGRRYRGAHLRGGGLPGPTRGLPGPLAPGDRHAAVDGRADPVRLRIPASRRQTSRSARPSPANRTPGSNGSTAPGAASTRPTSRRPARPMSWSAAAGITETCRR